MTNKDKRNARVPEGAAFVRVRLVRSLIGYPRIQRETAKGLGLRKIDSEVVRPNTPEVRGMINKICHLLKVDVSEEQ
jgi:large subunit ribosomal protein L30